MGNNFIIVNPTKREFIDPWCFGDNEKTGGYLKGLHPLAVALLVCPAYLAPTTVGLEGSWIGDELVIATEAATPEYAGRNLYRTALDEFRDLSYPALSMLCERSPDIGDALAKRAKSEFEFSAVSRLSCLRTLASASSRVDAANLIRLWPNTSTRIGRTSTNDSTRTSPERRRRWYEQEKDAPGRNRVVPPTRVG